MIRRGEGGWVEVGRAFMVARHPETLLIPVGPRSLTSRIISDTISI